jgi:hypothetical protein
MLNLFINKNREFDRYSKGIIDDCFARDNNFALKLLDYKATMFHRCYPLDVAKRANCHSFLASDTVQKHLSDKWYHHFDHQQRLMKIPIAFWVC